MHLLEPEYCVTLGMSYTDVSAKWGLPIIDRFVMSASYEEEAECGAINVFLRPCSADSPRYLIAYFVPAGETGRLCNYVVTNGPIPSDKIEASWYLSAILEEGGKGR